LYPARFPWQFRRIDELAAKLPDKSKQDIRTKDETKKVV
jgi:NAD+ synthase (glutamine-hydrolysing)